MSSIPRALRRAVALLVATVAIIAGSVALAAPASATYYPKPVMKVSPKIAGAPVVGSTLTVSTGGWLASPPLFFSFAWRDSVKSLLSSTNTYTPTKADVGQVLIVRVTAMDGNNHSSSIDIKTPAITVSDVVNSKRPTLSGGNAVGQTLTLHQGTWTSGSGALTYTYLWTSTDGTTSTPLKDTGTTHRITKADLGLDIQVVVTAKSTTQQGSAKVRTAGAIVPAAPVSSDAKLNSGNQGRLTGSVASQVVTIKDAHGKSGDHVFVYSYSSPVQMGWFALGVDKKFTLNIGPLAPGAHKLTVQDASGKLVGWLQVTRAGPSLAGTGNSLIAIGAGIVLVAILVVVIVTAQVRRKRKGAPRH